MAIIFSNHLATALFFLIWSGKRDRYKTAQGGGENVKPSNFQKTVMCRFDSCLKKTVFGVVKDYYKELKKNQAEAIPFCELPDIIIDKVAIWDTYKTDYTTFNICGHDIYVYDDELAKVIKQLSDRYRENVLMYHKEIICLLQRFIECSRSTQS